MEGTAIGAVLLAPGLEAEQTPDQRDMACPVFEMFVQNPTYEVILEHAALPDAGFRKLLLDP